jgi:basic membrane protein A
MKKIRFFSFLLAIILIIALSACGNNSSSSDQGNDSGDNAASGGQLAAVFGAGHTEGINDKAFIQDCWDAMTEFGEANGKTCAYYMPIDDSKQSFLDAYDTAIKNGAEVIVAIGNEPSDSLKDATWNYPDIKFISIESTGFDEIAPNHNAILMNATDAGWLAGVSAVREGFKSLGILPCVAIQPVDMWSWGYVQGANWAAGKYGIEGITLKHHYLNAWSASPEIQNAAAAWYNSGVEVIQCNTAGGNTSIIAASDAAGKAVYGSDKDQFEEGKTVVSSEVVFRKPVVYNALEEAYNGKFPGGATPLPGGVSSMPGIEVDASGLIMEPNRFKNYTIDMYEEDYNALKNDVDGIRSKMITIFDIGDVNEMWAAVEPKYIEFEDIQ